MSTPNRDQNWLLIQAGTDWKDLGEVRRVAFELRRHVRDILAPGDWYAKAELDYEEWGEDWLDALDNQMVDEGWWPPRME